jgi:hypothetical protein
MTTSTKNLASTCVRSSNLTLFLTALVVHNDGIDSHHGVWPVCVLKPGAYEHSPLTWTAFMRWG